MKETQNTLGGNITLIKLINPPSSYMIDDRVFPHIGILYLATRWRQRGLDIQIEDLLGRKDWENRTMEIANETNSFWFTSSTASFPFVYQMNKLIKQLNPKAFTMIGGSHASAISMLRKEGIYDVNTKRLEEFDIIFNGEAEKRLNLSKKWSDGELTNVDEELIPDRSLVDIKSYKYFLDGRLATIIMTQRGCPFRCEFCCGRDMDMYRKPRQRDPINVVKEMDQLNKDFGYSAFMWFDDEINIRPERLKNLCDLLKDRDYKHRGFVRSDLLVKYPETIDYLADAGFVELGIGVESGSDRILNVINKGTNTEINLKAIDMIKQKGMRVKTFTIIGHPSETHKDVELTRDFLRTARPDNFDITILTPYPGSIIYDRAKPSKKYLGYEFEYNGLYLNHPDFSREQIFYKGIPGKYGCNTRTDELTSQDILNLREEIDAR
jgi:anaerobic magnesium-protoporphyrin IX monomethyl ester cyclase